MGNEKNRMQRALHHLDWILEALKNAASRKKLVAHQRCRT
jgi:hypothetical protein